MQGKDLIKCNHNVDINKMIFMAEHKEFIEISGEMYMFKKARFGNPLGYELPAVDNDGVKYVPEELIFEGEDGLEVSLHIDHPLLTIQ